MQLAPCREAATEAVQRARVAEEMAHAEHLEREAAVRTAHARAATKFAGELSVAMRSSGADMRSLELQLAASERARVREATEAAASAQQQSRLVDSLREELAAAKFVCSQAEMQRQSQQQMTQAQLDGQRRYLQEQASRAERELWSERDEGARKLKEREQAAQQERRLATDVCVGYAKVAAESQAVAAAAEQAAKEAYEDARLAHSERAMLRLIRNGNGCAPASEQLAFGALSSAVHVPLARAGALAQKVATARARYGPQ